MPYLSFLYTQCDIIVTCLCPFLPQAKEMVELSRSIANKIKDKQGDITEDEVKEGTLQAN